LYYYVGLALAERITVFEGRITDGPVTVGTFEWEGDEPHFTFRSEEHQQNQQQYRDEALRYIHKTRFDLTVTRDGRLERIEELQGVDDAARIFAELTVQLPTGMRLSEAQVADALYAFGGISRMVIQSVNERKMEWVDYKLSRRMVPWFEAESQAV
jgi:hypothetical protein